MGRELVKAILDAQDLTLAAVVARRGAGERLATLMSEPRAQIRVSASVGEALQDARADVFIDYTQPEAVKQNLRVAIEAGCHAVVGTSGLSDEDYADVDAWAKRKGVGVFVAGNFSITATLLQHFAVQLARHMPHWEILDYAADTKPDAPSGTARELAYQLSRVAQPQCSVPVSATQGMKEARGATLNGSQLHSVRIPGFYSACEVIFGEAGERMQLRHESTSYAPYVAGTLLAVRQVRQFTGVRRGLPELLGLDGLP